MNNCQVCGKSYELKDYGLYCSVECRDSDIAILGKSYSCKCCGDTFKSIRKTALCMNCLKAPEPVLTEPVFQSVNISPFKYSIFEDNINRIVEAANRGDSRNCYHAVSVISDTVDSSVLPDIKNFLETSNETAKIWLIELMARLKDKRAIYHLTHSLNTNDQKVKAKAQEAITLLESY